MKNILLYTMLALMTTLWLGCEECEDPTNPECDNYDPCYGKTPITASFEMYEYTYDLDDWLEKFDMKQAPMLDDTALVNIIYFEAPEGFSSYTWHVGAETIQGRTFSRSHFPVNVDIPIQLIVTGETNPCFPDDDGIDTLTRNLHVLRLEGNDPLVQYSSHIVGIYKGTHINTPSDVFTIKITEFEYTDRNGGGYEYKPKIYNFPPDVCDVLISGGEPSNRNQMAFFTQGETDLEKCGRQGGIITVTLDSIDIQYLDFDDNDKFYHFRGVRLN